MSEASIIINVSEQEHLHSNGLSGTWIVPPKKPTEDFSILVIYPTPEIQDIGDGRRTVHWLKARPLAMDILGLRSDSAAHTFGAPGTKEKWGLLLCEAEPDLPKSLLRTIEEEILYLNDNMPDVKFRKDAKSGATVAVNIEPESVQREKIRLSSAVQEERRKFEQDCRKLVTKAEIHKARQALAAEDGRLVAEGDQMWGREPERPNINETHRRACRRLGQSRPWCYTPEQLVDCPGCGNKIRENVLSCPHCGGWLDEGIEKLRAMPPKQRSKLMYPERYAQPEPVGAKPKS